MPPKRWSIPPPTASVSSDSGSDVAFQQGLLNEAQVNYQAVLRKQPNHPEANHRLAVIADRQNDFLSAERYYQAAVAAAPRDANILNDLGYSYLLQSRYPEAERYLTAALQQSPNQANAMNNLGMLHAKRGQADQALAMIDEPTREERHCLSAFRYGRNRAVLHRDARLMPRRRRLWSSWNFMAEESAHGQSSAVTYWINALQPLPTTTDFFVSLNPQREPAAGLVEREFSYEHPIFTGEAARMQKRLWGLQGRQRTWFCGAHFGAGFHEDGLQSGLAVAEQLGGMLRPWDVPNQSGRIHVMPSSYAAELSHLEAAE